jgi:hypothetical protein
MLCGAWLLSYFQKFDLVARRCFFFFWFASESLSQENLSILAGVFVDPRRSCCRASDASPRGWPNFCSEADALREKLIVWKVSRDNLLRYRFICLWFAGSAFLYSNLGANSSAKQAILCGAWCVMLPKERSSSHHPYWIQQHIRGIQWPWLSKYLETTLSGPPRHNPCFIMGSQIDLHFSPGWGTASMRTSNRGWSLSLRLAAIDSAGRGGLK